MIGPFALLIAAHAAAPSVEAWVDTRGGSPALIVQVRAAEGAAWTLDLPKPDGLAIGDPSTTVERLAGGAERVTTSRYPLSGGGSFVIEGVCARDGADRACADALYLDLGKPPDRSGMADIIDPDRLLPVDPWVLGAAALVALAAIGVGARALRRRPARPAPVIVAPPEAPHLAALRRWEAVRADPSLDDHARALALSEIFRDYVEATLSFAARALSTTEILRHLEQLTFLPRENLPRAKRLLRATDRVKYADDQPGTDLFEELDSDLRAFVESTRPKSWDAR